MNKHYCFGQAVLKHVYVASTWLSLFLFGMFYYQVTKHIKEHRHTPHGHADMAMGMDMDEIIRVFCLDSLAF